MATLVELQRQLESAQIEFQYLRVQARTLAQEYAQAGNPSSGPIYDQVVANSLALKEVASRIDTLIIQIAQVNSSGTSAGNIIQNDDQATVPNASTQRPESPPLILNNDGRIEAPPSTTSGTNAQLSPSPDAQDFGTDDELRPLIVTQGTTTSQQQQQQQGVLTNPVPGDGREDEPVAGVIPGSGAGGDDSGAVSTSTVQREVDILFNEEKIVPQSNVLDQYASYTYTASIYLMTLEAVGNMMRTKKKDLNGSLLLIQSGGAPVGARNQFFTNDYYIESIRINSQILGKGTTMAHNVNSISMTIVEPNGITLIDNLDLAITQYLGSDYKKKNWGAANYLLVIRFYGYDVNGNLVRGGVPKVDGSTDENAFIEKFYPFSLNGLTFQVGNKAVEYNITAAPFQYSTSVGTNRGTIPYNLELGGQSVKDILTGPASFVSNAFSNPYSQNLNQQAQDLIAAAGGTVPAPQNISAAPSTKNQSIRQGLFTALNQFQQNLVPRVYEVADVYEVEFVGDAIPNATLSKGGPDALDTGYLCVPIPTSPDQSLLGNLSMDPTTRIDGVVAGTQIVQAIEAIVRNSTYIQSQQLYKYNEKTKKWNPSNPGARNLAWYKVSFEAYPIAWDQKRNDYAYRMKYIVSPYRINDAPPPYFPQPEFKGAHKIYEYWFTGQNTQVMEYVQRYNNQYTQVLSGGIAPSLAKQTQNVNTLQKYNFSPNSAESSQQGDSYVNEPAANLADYLYNPSDLNTVDMTIVGDPAWLQQGEAFAGQRPDNWNFSAFAPDGTINFDSQQVLFEVLFNKPVDYDLNTGLIDAGKNNFDANRNSGQPGRARQSFLFQAKTVESVFERGKFTQKLSGLARRYATPNAASSAYQLTSLEQQAQELQQAFGQTRFGTGVTPFVPGTTVSNPLYAPVINSVSSAAGQALRGISSRVIPPPQSPTSSGQAVGAVNTSGIDPTTGQTFSSNERVVTGQDATPDNNTQVGAADDDAGYGFDPFSQENQDDLNSAFGGNLEI